MVTEVIKFRVTYVQGPEVQIRNNPDASKWDDSPDTNAQVFDIVVIQDQVPTMVRIRRIVCAFPSHQYIT